MHSKKSVVGGVNCLRLILNPYLTVTSVQISNCTLTWFLLWPLVTWRKKVTRPCEGGARQRAAWRNSRENVCKIKRITQNKSTENNEGTKTYNKSWTNGQGIHWRKHEDFEVLTKEGGGRENVAHSPCYLHHIDGPDSSASLHNVLKLQSCFVSCSVQYIRWGRQLVKYSMCKILDARRNVYMSLFYVIACS